MSDPVLVFVDPATPLPSGAEPGPDRISVRDPELPWVSVRDVGVTRGDGIFESFGVLGGEVQAVQPHLRRLQRSAAMLDLPELDLAAMEEAVRLAARLHGQVPDLLVKLVVTRGIEGVEAPTAWAYAFQGEDFTSRQRSGVKVACLDRGYRSDVATTSPWLLQGAKTLSYAVNKAALREASRRGADDVIFISSDGYVLEGPQSTVIAKYGEVLVTPPTEFGILEGTTQAAVFEIAESLGWRCEVRHLTRTDLDEAEAVWLASSGQQLTPVLELDGKPVGRADDVGEPILEGLLARRS